jgi:hypothetical protein
MLEGYDLFAGILVAVVVLVMIGASFGSSHP